MGSFSIWHWLVVLVIVALVFGTKKLRNIGGDVGSAVKDFKEAVNESKKNSPQIQDHHVETVKSDLNPNVKQRNT